MHNDLRGALGLAQRAGLISSGQEVVREALVAHRAFLLLLASDASQRTRKQFMALAEQHRVPLREPGTMQDYGSALGKPDRAVVAVLDRGFAQSMLAKIDRETSTSAYGGG